MAEVRADGATTSTTAGAPGAPSDATSPQRLSARDWARVLQRAGREVLDDRLMLYAAGVSFFALLSIAPLLVTAMSVYGAINTPQEAMEQLSEVVRKLPDELQPLVADQLTTITTASGQVLTVRGLIGLLLALFTATTAATYLIDALTLAYHETETRSLLRRTLLAVVFVLAGALLVGAVLVGAGMVSDWLDSAPGPVRAAGPVLAWVVLATLLAMTLSLLYRFAPDRKQARWRWISVGALAATVLWLGTSVALLAYVQTLGSYETTYGPLAGVAISMFWLWLTVFLLIVGASVNAETERQTVRDSTVGPERPLGERGAVVADSAPPYPGEE
ncbi:YihY/virulence factor BrkB family protein [Blastococcus sp. CT_GayMR20]|uniref:YihY/virulence factor BrkB family protein n=1 Tax=Blastococcus sp. CT_GayMR20 TaxID=2559609 RepID=UPI0010731FA1|nr:YihY/virulence factor BrkB family protein [Blastococcus sp. CT_GayMR20]TFV65739.1 YihY/virulence factor BrkB family protein [Blastococcus sp. CT_GayMR20]